MSIRGDLRRDGDRCAGCSRRLADHADLVRVSRDDGLDVLALCRGCAQPTVIPWIRETAR